MIEVEFTEGQTLLKTHRCHCDVGLVLAWGGADGINGYVLKCAEDPEHTGMVEQPTVSQAIRRAGGGPIHAQNRVEARSLQAMDMTRAITMVQHRFPRARLDEGTAAFFLWDCMRQGVDPLLGEAVPIPFKGKDGKPLTVTILTEDGFLSMAARACPDTWTGPPQTSPVTEPELRKAICGDEDALVWEAKGNRKGGQEYTTWGWIKPKEIREGQSSGTPKGDLPGNQARIRAIKRWIREVYPEARHKMMELYQESLERLQIEGDPQSMLEVGAIIDAEYHVVQGEPQDKPPQADQKAKPAEALGPGAQRTAAETKPNGDKVPSNLGDLFTWSWKEYELNKTAVLEILRLQDQKGIADLADAWDKVKASQTADKEVPSEGSGS